MNTLLIILTIVTIANTIGFVYLYNAVKNLEETRFMIPTSWEA